MKFGVHILASDRSCDLREIGKQAEAAGFDSLFLPEHTHIPVHGDFHSGGEDLHGRMQRLPDPLTALTAVAAVTERIRVATGVSMIAQHDPVIMAKRIATLDQISNGRFMLGVGTGWNRTQSMTHGVSARDRWAVMRENVLALKRIWTEDQAAFHGEFVDFAPLWSWPKPVQQPHPPVIIGGEGPTVLDRVLEYGDAWGPHPVPGILERVRELNRRAAEVERDSISVTLFNVPLDAMEIREYEAAGIERCVLYIRDDGPGSVEAGLAEYAAFIKTYQIRHSAGVGDA